MQRVLLLSIQSSYADKIFNGEKTVELRRVRLRLQKGDHVFVYVPSPKKKLIGGFEVERIVEAVPEDLWEDVKHHAGITQKEFEEYYSKQSLGFGIFFYKTWCFRAPLYLDDLKQVWPEFRPPQGYWYLTPAEVDRIQSFVQLI
jgi:predicted transcriptional regulator